MTKAIEGGADIQISYSATTGAVEVSLVHLNGTRNELFAGNASAEDDDDELGYGGSSLNRAW
jgi:hypothetical protein